MKELTRNVNRDSSFTSGGNRPDNNLSGFSDGGGEGLASLTNYTSMMDFTQEDSFVDEANNRVPYTK